jgi:hypothetical protein
MRRRAIHISRPHHQLDVKRPEINNEATNRFKGESMEIRFRREAIALAHQAGHQLAVIALSLFFVPMHIVTALFIGDGLLLRSGSYFKPFL